MKRFATASKTRRPIFQFWNIFAVWHLIRIFSNVINFPKFSSFYTCFFFHWYSENWTPVTSHQVVCFCLTLGGISWVRVEKNCWDLSLSNWVIPAEPSWARSDRSPTAHSVVLQFVLVLFRALWLWFCFLASHTTHQIKISSKYLYLST